jgi:PhnB protein
MTRVNVYLTFDGNCYEAFEFYKSVFGGEFLYVGRFDEMPAEEGLPKIPESEKNRIMHISLPISEETILMGSDSSPSFGEKLISGNNFSISVHTDSKEKADQFFNKLSEGGKVTMPMNKTYWGSYFGMCTDKFSINWMVNMDLNN